MGGDIAGPADPRDIPDPTLQFTNLGRKERKGWGGREAGGHFYRWNLPSQVTVTFDGAPFS